MLVAALCLSFLQGAQASCCNPGMAAFADDPAFVAMHLSPLPLSFEPAAGREVVFKDAAGKSAKGFWVPPKRGVKSAIVMIHEWWGLNDYIRREAERVQSVGGWGVLAVDLYEGKVATDAAQAGKLMQGVDDARAKAIVKGAVLALKGGSLQGFKASKVGSVGFCFGGGWSFQTAVQGGKDVQACVVFYGMPDMTPASIAAVRAPVLMIHPTKDKWITSEVVGGFSRAMKAAGKSVRVVDFEADHAFANPSNPLYDKKAADAAWKEAFALFKKQLG